MSKAPQLQTFGEILYLSRLLYGVVVGVGISLQAVYLIALSETKFRGFANVVPSVAVGNRGDFLTFYASDSFQINIGAYSPQYSAFQVCSVRGN